MKFIKILSTVFILSIATSTISAFSPGQPYSQRLHKLISKLNLESQGMSKVNLKIKFILNPQREMLVLDTNHEKLDSYLKEALNYQKVQDPSLKPLKVYIVPITIQ